MKLVPIGGLWAILTAYNLFKPYHVDDAACLFIAQLLRLRSAVRFHQICGAIGRTGIHYDDFCRYV